jgi:hypothetical protein
MTTKFWYENMTGKAALGDVVVEGILMLKLGYIIWCERVNWLN